MKLKLNGKYNWKNQPERLIYVGKKGSWHQFVKVDSPLKVWCEVLDEDLHMLEETKP
jgi:acyl dehydratase